MGAIRTDTAGRMSDGAGYNIRCHVSTRRSGAACNAQPYTSCIGDLKVAIVASN
jgi:hypothetical protein